MLTKRKALEECVRMWKFLAKTGGRKPAYTHKYLYDCPICEYMRSIAPVHQKENGVQSSICEESHPAWCNRNCLMKNVWNEKRGCNGGENSPFVRWLKDTSAARKKHAAIIWKGAQKILDEMGDSDD